MVMTMMMVSVHARGTTEQGERAEQFTIRCGISTAPSLFVIMIGDDGGSRRARDPCQQVVRAQFPPFHGSIGSASGVDACVYMCVYVCVCV